MNNQRRKQLRVAAQLIQDALYELEEVCQAEDHAVEATPESLQDTHQYSERVDLRDGLWDIHKEVDDCIAKLEAIATGTKHQAQPSELDLAFQREEKERLQKQEKQIRDYRDWLEKTAWDLVGKGKLKMTKEQITQCKTWELLDHCNTAAGIKPDPNAVDLREEATKIFRRKS